MEVAFREAVYAWIFPLGKQDYWRIAGCKESVNAIVDDRQRVNVPWMPAFDPLEYPAVEL